MNIEDFGWKQYSKNNKSLGDISTSNVARVVVENKTNFILFSNSGELEGVVRGGMRKNADLLPKVGDFVVFEKLHGEAKAVIVQVLPRKTKISRGYDNTKEQIIAANVDIVFIVQALDADFNVRKIERYVTVAKNGGCTSIVVLNKSDMVELASQKLSEAKEVAGDSLVVLSSIKTGEGLETIRSNIPEGSTVVFVGSSGVGKSSLINYLAGADLFKTQDVRVSDGKGLHTTTRRELIVLGNGICIIDTPGMRELEVFDEQGVAYQGVFSDIEVYTQQCTYSNCDHEKSEGCAVVAAVKSGKISYARYQSFLKLSRGIGRKRKDTSDMRQRKSNNKSNKRLHKSTKK